MFFHPKNEFRKISFINQRKVETEPAAAEKSEKGKQKTDNSRSTLSEKEKAEILKQYQATKSRIDEAQKKLYECLRIIRYLPKGHEYREKAEKLYDQATKILTGIIRDFPTDIKDTQDVIKLVKTTVALEKQQLLEVLYKNGLDVSCVINDLFIVEQDASIILKNYQKFRQIGLSEIEALRALSCVCWRSEDLGYKALFDYLNKTQKMGIKFNDAINLWKRSAVDKGPVALLKIMQKRGISDDFYRIYKLSGTDLKNLKEVMELIKRLNKSGLTTEQAIGALSVVCSRTALLGNEIFVDYISAALSLGVKYEDALSLWKEMPREGKLPEPSDFIKSLKTVRVTDNFYKIYTLAKENPDIDYLRIGILINLKNVEISDKKIIEIAKMEGEARDLFIYFDTLRRETGLFVEEIIKLYSVETDISLLTAYLKTLKELNYPASLFSEFYSLEKNPEKLKKLADIAKIFQEKNFPRIYALIMAKMISDSNRYAKIISILGMIAKAVKFITECQARGIKQSSIIILWKLSFRKFEEISEFILNSDLVSADLQEAMTFIDDLMEFGLEQKDIIAYFKGISHNPNDVISTLKLMKEFPKIIMKIWEIIGVKDLTDIANFYYSQTEETRIFLKHIINHSYLITLLNLQYSLEDPALPLAIQVYETMDVKDIATALKIGRNLFYQGFTSISDKAVIDQKIKEIDALNEENDDLKIFEGRNIIFFSNNDRELIFDTPEIRKDLGKSVGPNGSLLMETAPEKPTAEQLRAMRNKIILAIINTPPPLTVFFNGHGGRDMLYMNEGQIVGNVPFGERISTLSHEDLAQAIAKRAEKFKDRKKELAKDIYIISSCYDHDFVRNLYKRNGELGGVQPITIVDAEFGQFSSGDIAGKNKDVLQLGQRGTTLRDIRKNETVYKKTDYTIYIPNPSGKPQQVAEKENKPSGKKPA